MKSRTLLLGLVLISFTLGAPQEADAACYQCKQKRCSAYDTGYKLCDDGTSCGSGGCIGWCAEHGGSCSGGCSGQQSPEGECLAIENKTALRVIPNGELMPLDFPPRHRFEPSSAQRCEAPETAPSSSPTAVESSDPRLREDKA